MTTLVSDNIVSALGFTTDENYLNVKQGKCGLRLFDDRFGLPEPFIAAAIDDERLELAFRQAQADWGNIRQTYTRLEKAAIVSVADAIKKAKIIPTGEQDIFVLSTTKGNIALLDDNKKVTSDLYLWRSAELIAGFFGNSNTPIVVSNACISGVSAMMMAQRALKQYRYAIVTGVDVLSRFIISGFQSFKALSPEVCRPFDANRKGLNIGEAAATVIMAERKASDISGGQAILVDSAVRNDANHISGPSRTGEGAYLAIRRATQSVHPSEIAFINAHGTATLYNDEMEAVALARAGLQDVPVNSLKGYFGHTLGAAGTLESIISICALMEGMALATRGFETLGLDNPLRVIATTQPLPSAKQPYCLKMLSGFGGCNAAALYKIYRT